MKGNLSDFYNVLKKAGYKIEKDGNILKVFDNSGKKILAEISENSIKIKYSGWGSDMITNSERTTTCIAKYEDVVNEPGSQFIKNEFPEGAYGRGAENKGASTF